MTDNFNNDQPPPFNYYLQRRPGFAEDVYGGPKYKTPDANPLKSTGTRPNSNYGLGGNAGLAQRRAANLPKLVELSSGFPDMNHVNSSINEQQHHAPRPNTDLKFRFADSDKHESELSELYSYSEIDDFAVNFDTFIQYMRDHNKNFIWNKLNINEKIKILTELAWQLENNDFNSRTRFARIVLYILQGAYGDFAEIDTDALTDRLIGSADCRLSIKSLEVCCDSLNEMGAVASGSITDRGTGGYEKRCLLNSVLNTYIVYECQLFQLLCSTLLLENQKPFDLEKCAERSLHSRQSSVCNSRSASHLDLADGGSSGSGFERRSHKSATLSDNESLRVIINCLYCMVENFRRTELDSEVVRASHGHFTLEKLAKLREQFVFELDEPLELSKTSLTIHLFEMLPPFVHGNAPHFPIKKILLLIWKVMLTILGNTKTLCEQKEKKRKGAGLPPIDDTFTAASCIAAVNVGNDAFLHGGSQAVLSRGVRSDPDAAMVRKVRVSHSIRTISRQIATSNSTEGQTSEGKQVTSANDADTSTPEKEQPNDEEKPETSLLADSAETASLPDKPRDLEFVEEPPTPTEEGANGGDQTPKASPGTPVEGKLLFRLPLKPKIREADIEQFLQMERQKHFGYKLPGNSESMFGLPTPILKSVEAMRRNLYTPLSDLQARDEELFLKYPFSQREFIEENSTERLYRNMLPNMTEFVIALLKVTLASLPSSKAKSDGLTVLSDVLTPETDTNEILSNSINLDLSGTYNLLEETVRVAIDINRHKEIIIKAASSIIILLLKAFKVNHCYQFENFAQLLVLANCIPLILKFLDQNICRYFQSKHELVPLNFPQCALYVVRNGNEHPQLNSENVDHEMESDCPSYFLWRNVYASVQFVRVLNKLTKGKNARTMMLVVFKSAPVLKRCMQAKVGVFHVYVLKLLKMQARYLGRQWRKSNMDLISAIYIRVRHHLNDDWAYANETKKSYDFQQYEGELSLLIKRFNSRRYGHLSAPSDTTDDAAKLHRTTDQTDGELWSIDDFRPSENSIQSVLSWKPKFSDAFTTNYEKWLEKEVYEKHTDWEALLADTKGLLKFTTNNEN